MDTDSAALSFALKDSFRIHGRGWILMPALPPDTFEHGTPLVVDIVEPNGRSRRATGHFLIEHLLIAGGQSRWDGVIAVDENQEKIPQGSRITCARRAR